MRGELLATRDLKESVEQNTHIYCVSPSGQRNMAFSENGYQGLMCGHTLRLLPGYGNNKAIIPANYFVVYREVFHNLHLAR